MEKIRGVLMGESILDWMIENGKGSLLTYGDKKKIFDICIENPTTRKDIYDYRCVMKIDENGKLRSVYEDKQGNSLMDCDIFMIAVGFSDPYNHNIYDIMRTIESMVF